MAFTLRAALDRIVVVEAALEITDPETLAIAHVYKYLPDANSTPEAPCFMHSFALTEVQHSVSGLRRQLYVVRSQFWTGNPNKDRAADICAAFLAEWVDAFSNDLTLDGACTGPIVFRGSTPSTLVDLEYGGLHSIGLELFVDIPMHEGVTVGP